MLGGLRDNPEGVHTLDLCLKADSCQLHLTSRLRTARSPLPQTFPIAAPKHLLSCERICAAKVCLIPCMTAAEEERLLPEGSESSPAQVSASSEEPEPDLPEPLPKMTEAPTRPTQTSLESRPEVDSQPGALRAFYGRTKDLAAGIFKEVFSTAIQLDRRTL